jgi:hypothetical protein
MLRLVRLLLKASLDPSPAPLLNGRRSKTAMNTFHQFPVCFVTPFSNHRSLRRGLRDVAIALIMTVVASGAALAAGGGPHGGSAHGGGRTHAGHFGVGRVSAYGRGYHGFGGGYGYYGGWGWGGLGAGLFFATLPLYYSTLWWNNTPYYYADANYYQWNAAAGEYETVRPPPEVESQINTQEPVATDLFAYPINGQDTEQQARDRYECHRWAKEQSGFDPTQTSVPDTVSTPPSGAVVADAVATPARRQNYLRAQAACLQGRGYSVK